MAGLHGGAVRSAIVAMFLETGEDVTIKVIAARLGWTETKTRRHLTGDDGFLPDGIQQREAGRTSYSKDYPGTEAGAHKVSVYGPTRAFLREIITAQSRGLPPLLGYMQPKTGG